MSAADGPFGPLVRGDGGGLIRSALRSIGWSPAYLWAEDEVQDGYIGLLKAVERFDPTMGVGFRTFAWKCITTECVRGRHAREGQSHRHNFKVTGEWVSHSSLDEWSDGHDPLVVRIAEILPDQPDSIGFNVDEQAVMALCNERDWIIATEHPEMAAEMLGIGTAGVRQARKRLAARIRKELVA